jgi:3-deoxy-D-manno-octulosonic-acid transferase
MASFREVAADFDAREAWSRVADARELGETWRRWLDDPEAARRVGERGKALVEENRGALGRTVEMLGPILERIVSR